MIQPLIKALPLTALNDALRASILEGTPLAPSMAAVAGDGCVGWYFVRAGAEVVSVDLGGGAGFRFSVNAPDALLLQESPICCTLLLVVHRGVCDLLAHRVGSAYRDGAAFAIGRNDNLTRSNHLAGFLVG